MLFLYLTISLLCRCLFCKRHRDVVGAGRLLRPGRAVARVRRRQSQSVAGARRCWNLRDLLRRIILVLSPAAWRCACRLVPSPPMSASERCCASSSSCCCLPWLVLVLSAPGRDRAPPLARAALHRVLPGVHRKRSSVSREPRRDYRRRRDHPFRLDRAGRAHQPLWQIAGRPGAGAGGVMPCSQYQQKPQGISMDLGIRRQEGAGLRRQQGARRRLRPGAGPGGGGAPHHRARGKDALEATADGYPRANGREGHHGRRRHHHAETGRKAALAACPQPDILVNNAGGPPPGDFRELGPRDWIKALDANMLTPIDLIRRPSTA